VGVPVAATTLPADAVVRSAQIPAGTFATVIHRGPYDALVQTRAALMDWAQLNNINRAMVEQRKVTRWDGRIEHYLVGPRDEPHPKNWQTEIAILIEAGFTVCADRATLGKRPGHSHSIVSITYEHLKLMDFLLACNGFTVKYTVN
jgi:GyrI-like small molecule binding domain